MFECKNPITFIHDHNLSEVIMSWLANLWNGHMVLALDEGSQSLSGHPKYPLAGLAAHITYTMHVNRISKHYNNIPKRMPHALYESMAWRLDASIRLLLLTSFWILSASSSSRALSSSLLRSASSLVSPLFGLLPLTIPFPNFNLDL